MYLCCFGGFFYQKKFPTKHKFYSNCGLLQQALYSKIFPEKTSLTSRDEQVHRQTYLSYMYASTEACSLVIAEWLLLLMHEILHHS